jgi:hypothetical protein
MKLWNSSSTYISTWLGKAEYGGIFRMSQFGESWSTTMTIPVCSSLYAWMMSRRSIPVPSWTLRRFGPRRCSAQ